MLSNSLAVMEGYNLGMKMDYGKKPQNVKDERAQNRLDAALIKSPMIRHYAEKVAAGTKISGSALASLRHREAEMNHKAYQEMWEERARLAKKRKDKMYICHCGKHKNITFRECFDCHTKRREAMKPYLQQPAQ